MSKKPISIKDKPSKKVLLDELESIKHLLDDEDSDFDPPILTQEVSTESDNNEADFDDDFPVLTDSLDEDSIPTLEATFEDQPEWEDMDAAEADNHTNTFEQEENDEDDIVSRAMKAQARLSAQANSQPSTQADNGHHPETAPTKSKSLFDDSDLEDELSPEMLALNAKPVSKPKPIEPKEEAPQPVETQKVMPTKPEPKKFLSLEEELDELAKNKSSDAPTDHTLDDAESSEILEEFDEYLEEDYLSEHETFEDDPSESGNEETTDLDEQADDSLFDVDASTDDDDIELETLADIEDFAGTGDQDEDEDQESSSDDSLLAAAILEVTDSISDGKLSEQIQESLTKEEHQPSLFDGVSSDEETEHNESTGVASPSSKTGKPSPSTKEAARTVTTAAKASSVRPSTQPINRPKTENPFLPKHIRERLHTNRTLQQEIDASSTHSFSRSPSNTGSNTASNTRSGTGAQGPVSAAPTSASAPTSATKPAQSYSKMTSDEERVVEEVIGSVLPKIESELREKIRELIKQEKSSK